jgi:hypothetical protein
MSTRDIALAQFAGTDVEKRYIYYWYLAQKELIEQERAQLSMAEGITHSELHNFGVATMFGGVIGAKYPMKPRHLVELAREVERIKHIDAVIDHVANPDIFDEEGHLLPEKDRKGLPLTVPDMESDDGWIVIEPYLIRLKTKFSIMEYRSFRGTPIRKWLDEVGKPDIDEETKSPLSQLMEGGDEDISEGEQP